MPENDLRLLIDAAREAGEIAQKHWKKDPETWEKADNAGPVTAADLAVDNHLRHRLLSERPEYGWLSEETEDDLQRLDHDKVFIVDPIDGTRSFVAGDRTWAHSLAIAENGTVTAAAVFLPALNLMYHAYKGGGAFLNDEAVFASQVCAIEESKVLSAKPGVAPEYWGGSAPAFERHFRPSLAYRLALVSEGRFDAMISLRKTWEWDIAAGVLLASEAGASVLDLQAQPFRFNSRVAKQDGIIAAPDALSRAMFGCLTLP